MALAGCSGGEPEANGGNAQAGADNRVEPPGPIPAALRGVWALEAEECGAQGAAADRLLVITSDEIRQFGRRAPLSGNIIEATPTSIDAEFMFEVEGTSVRDQQGLRLWRDKLVRRNGSQTETTLYFPCR